MPSYQQTGIRTCPKCKEETQKKVCPSCNQKTKANGKWSVRFYCKVGEKNILKRLSGYDTKTEAEQAYNNFQINAKHDSSLIAKLSIEELALNFFNYKKTRIRESSYIACEPLYRKFIKPYFKDANVYKLDKKDIINWQTWVNSLCKHKSTEKYSFEQKSKMHTFLSSMLNHCVKFYDLPKNVAQIVGNFVNTDPVKKNMLFWTEEEFKTFIQKVDDITYKALYSFLYLTGTRRGEALALTWNDVDFVEKSVNINKSMTLKTENAVYKITSTKNISSNRKIYIPETLATILNELKLKCSSYLNFNENSFVFGFTRPLPPETVRRKFFYYCDKAKVKHIRIHDLRHSHASLLINKGQNILAIAQRLGHSDIEQTLNTYAHFMPEEQKKLLTAINITI